MGHRGLSPVGLDGWRVGFELELVLGDLGDYRFIAEREGPMDRASPAFCQTVTKRLREATGYPWSAPRQYPRRTGFFVLDEYDLDPIDWPRSRVAGVELLTPPLPMAEAEGCRQRIIEAIFAIDGAFNFLTGVATERCAWHANVDLPEQPIYPSAFLASANEFPILANNGRLFSRYAAPQTHAFGIPLLRHLIAERDAALLCWSGIENLLSHHIGKGKRFATNFGKLDSGYVELRHFRSSAFLDEVADLEELLAPLLGALAAPPEDEDNDRLIKTFGTLADWLVSVGDRLGISTPHDGWQILWTGALTFDGEPIGYANWNGDLEVILESRTKYEPIAVMRGVQWPDWKLSVAILALQYVQCREMKLVSKRSASPAFSRAMTELSRKLAP